MPKHPLAQGGGATQALLVGVAGVGEPDAPVGKAHHYIGGTHITHCERTLAERPERTGQRPGGLAAHSACEGAMSAAVCPVHPATDVGCSQKGNPPHEPCAPSRVREAPHAARLVARVDGEDAGQKLDARKGACRLLALEADVQPAIWARGCAVGEVGAAPQRGHLARRDVDRLYLALIGRAGRRRFEGLGGKYDVAGNVGGALVCTERLGRSLCQDFKGRFGAQQSVEFGRPRIKGDAARAFDACFFRGLPPAPPDPGCSTGRGRRFIARHARPAGRRHGADVSCGRSRHKVCRENSRMLSNAARMRPAGSRVVAHYNRPCRMRRQASSWLPALRPRCPTPCRAKYF
eukprot:scaffold11564_cov116-Isochrysis_galbana.AAC.6